MIPKQGGRPEVDVYIFAFCQHGNSENLDATWGEEVGAHPHQKHVSIRKYNRKHVFSLG